MKVGFAPRALESIRYRHRWWQAHRDKAPGLFGIENRERIKNDRTPIVDDAWIEWFPGDANLRGEKISIHHIKGGILNMPLPKSRHRDAHMPGGTSTNPGGPGVTGAIEKEDDGTRTA